MAIENVALLTIADVGRTPRKKNDSEEYGSMNGGLIRYDGEANLDSGEIEELATLYNVGRRTVECWFGIPDQHGRVKYLNCVPLDVCGAPARFGRPATERRRLCNCSPSQQLRIFLAAPLVVDGGITREPIFTKTDKRGNLFIEELRKPQSSLADCAQYIESVYNGGEYSKEKITLRLAWIQIMIEGGPGSWEVIVNYTFPDVEEDSDGPDDSCAEAEAGDSTTTD